MSDPFGVFRPQRGRRVAQVIGGVSLLIFGGLAALMPATGYPGWSTGDSLLVLGFGLLLLAMMSRFWRLRAVPDRAGLVVRNVLLTHRLVWADIEKVRFGADDAWAWLDLRSGEEVAVMAVQRSDGARARTEASRLMALVETQGGTTREPWPREP